jgi:hypothetical protein
MESEAERGCGPPVLKRGTSQQTAGDALQQAFWRVMRGIPGQQKGGADVHNAAEQPRRENGRQRTRGAGTRRGFRLSVTRCQQHLALDRFDVEHLVGSAEAVAFIERTTGVGRMQRHYANAAAAGLG